MRCLPRSDGDFAFDGGVCGVDLGFDFGLECGLDRLPVAFRAVLICFRDLCLGLDGELREGLLGLRRQFGEDVDLEVLDGGDVFGPGLDFVGPGFQVELAVLDELVQPVAGDGQVVVESLGPVFGDLLGPGLRS